MSKPNPAALFIILLITIAILGGVSVTKGVFLIAKHEGDTLHLMQIIFRMADGQIPHLDFMTPIGALAFAPIVFFVDQGVGIGQSILFSQVLMAVLILPMALWVGISRLSPALSVVFGIMIMVLMLALVHGESNASVSISMHYNRWAWALAFIAITLAVLPPTHRQNALADGVVAGLALTGLAMIKVTFFAAFIIPVTLGFLMHRQFRALLIGIAVAFIVVLLLTYWLGTDYWLAYLRDLLTVARSEIRPEPGRSFGKVVGEPAFLGGSLAAIYAIIAVRQAGHAIAGVLLLLLVPGFFYVTYQNFANDPQWLLLLGVLMLSLQQTAESGQNGFGWEHRSALATIGVIALSLASPSFVNLAYSPLRHMAADEENYSPMLPRATTHTDLMTASVRANRIDGDIPLDVQGSGLEAYAEHAEREEVGTLFGAPLPRCNLKIGLPAWLDAITADLETAGYGDGTRIFAADLLSSHWMFGSLLPLEGGAPWYYGGLPGFESADYVLVPNCPISVEVRRLILEEIEETDGILLEEIRRTPLYVLLEKS